MYNARNFDILWDADYSMAFATLLKSTFEFVRQFGNCGFLCISRISITLLGYIYRTYLLEYLLYLQIFFLLFARRINSHLKCLPFVFLSTFYLARYHVWQYYHSSCEIWKPNIFPAFSCLLLCSCNKRKVSWAFSFRLPVDRWKRSCAI